MVKIMFWDGFRPFSAPDSNSASKTVYIHRFRSVFHRFLKIQFFWKSVFVHLLTFERYFKVWEHFHRMQHEKIPPGSYSQIFWPDGMPVGAWRRSLLTWNSPLFFGASNLDFFGDFKKF